MFDPSTDPISGAALLSKFSQADLEELIDENPNLRGYIQGYLAELILRRRISEFPGVESVTKIPDKDAMRGDLLVTYKGHQFKIESKSLSSRLYKEDLLNGGWTGSVGLKHTGKRPVDLTGIGTTWINNVAKNGFDILSIACLTSEGDWNFLFLDQDFIPESSSYNGYHATSFRINPEHTPGLTDDLVKLLELKLKSRLKYEHE